METTDQDVLEDLARSDREAQRLMLKAFSLDEKADGHGVALVRWIYRLRYHRTVSDLVRAQEEHSAFKRIARRRGLLGHRSARRATFSDHF